MSSCPERTTFTPNHGKIESPKTGWTETINAALGDRYLIAEHNLPTYFDHGHYGGELNCNFGLYLDNYGQVWKIYLEDGSYPEQKKRIIPLNRSDCPLTDYLIDYAKKEWQGQGPSPLNPKSYNGYINRVPMFEGGLRSEFGPATIPLSRHYCGDKTLDAVVLPQIDNCMAKIRSIEETNTLKVDELEKQLDIMNGRHLAIAKGVIHMTQLQERIDALETENKQLQERLATLESFILGTSVPRH